MSVHGVWQEFGVDTRPGGGWSLICQPASDEFEDEPFLISDMVIGLIAELEQEEGVEIIHNDKMGLVESE